MTRTERMKLAKAARELAMECVEGTAPKFGTGDEYVDGKPHCAMGHVNARAGIPQHMGWAASKTCALYWTLASAHDSFDGAARMDALVFPLLWAATEMDGKIL